MDPRDEVANPDKFQRAANGFRTFVLTVALAHGFAITTLVYMTAKTRSVWVVVVAVCVCVCMCVWELDWVLSICERVTTHLCTSCDVRQWWPSEPGRNTGHYADRRYAHRQRLRLHWCPDARRHYWRCAADGKSG